MSNPNYALGEVVTGMSYPQVANYAAAAGVVTYSNVADLARGVSVNPQITVANADNKLYLNNRAAEVAKKHFRSGTLGVGVDGLFTAAERQIMGLSASTQSVTIGENKTATFNTYDDDQDTPYMGFGVVLQCQSNGITFYRAWIYRKIQFALFDVPATTEGQDIDWQTQSLSADILVDDTAKHAWKWFSEPLESELDAYNAVRVAFGGTAVAALPE